MAYSLDTSYLVEAWRVWYPLGEFPGVWRVLASAAVSRQVLIIDRVHDELSKQVPDLVQFFDDHIPAWIHPTANNTALDAALRTLESDLLAGKVIRAYPQQNINKFLRVADPALVLHAKLDGHIVVSNELSDRLSKKSPKIPDLCQYVGVRHADPAEFAGVWGYDFDASEK